MSGHKCTAQSATEIAQQLPGAPWQYERSFDAVAALPWPTVTKSYDVTTQMGPKNIPVKFVSAKGARIVLTCPYTGEQFVFTKTAGARPLFGAPTAKPGQHGPVHAVPLQPKQGLSTGQKVAVGAGITIGGVALTTLIASAVLGVGVEALVKGAWHKIREVI